MHTDCEHIEDIQDIVQVYGIKYSRIFLKKTLGVKPSTDNCVI